MQREAVSPTKLALQWPGGVSGFSDSHKHQLLGEGRQLLFCALLVCFPRTSSQQRQWPHSQWGWTTYTFGLVL